MISGRVEPRVVGHRFGEVFEDEAQPRGDPLVYVHNVSLHVNSLKTLAAPALKHSFASIRLHHHASFMHANTLEGDEALQWSGEHELHESRLIDEARMEQGLMNLVAEEH